MIKRAKRACFFSLFDIQRKYFKKILLSALYREEMKGSAVPELECFLIQSYISDFVYTAF